MKKTFLITIVCLLSIVAILKARKNRPMDIALANIEALAADESIYDYTQPETVPCDYQEGHWHTASVERVCAFCAVPYSCTPKACGEVF